MNSNYNVVGIDAAGLEKIKVAIEEYIKAVKNSSTIEATGKEIKQAIKGSNVEAQVTALALKVDQSIDQIIGTVNTFSNKIDTVKANYAKYDTSASAIQNATKNIKSQFISFFYFDNLYSF